MDTAVVNGHTIIQNIEIIYTAMVAVIGAILSIWAHFRIKKVTKIMQTGEK